MAIPTIPGASPLKRPILQHMCAQKNTTCTASPHKHTLTQRTQTSSDGNFPSWSCVPTGGEKTEPKSTQMPPTEACGIPGHTESLSPCGHMLLSCWYWCNCSCLFCFHPSSFLLGGAMSVSCPMNTGRVEGPFRETTTRKGKWGTTRRAACCNVAPS